MRLGVTFDDVLLVPQYSEVKSRKDVSTFSRLSNHIALDIPIISANMDTITDFNMALSMGLQGGLGIIHRFMSIEQQSQIVNKLHNLGHEMLSAAVGIHEEDKNRVEKLVESGVNAICVDIAHGDSKGCIDMIKWIERSYPKIDLIAGNVCTADGALRLANAGANVIKVGVGAGSICITRVISGFGVPQLTAIMDISEALETCDASIIADGGIRGSNDIVKALAAGASSVMLGNLLSGTEETPGEIGS